MAKSAQLVVRKNLGLSDGFVGAFLRDEATVRKALSIAMCGVTPALHLVFAVLRRLPSNLKNVVLLAAWRLCLLLHQKLPPKLVRRGLSCELSVEAHALANVAWWARLVPGIPVRLIRDMLSMLDAVEPPPSDFRAEAIREPERGVQGVYLHGCAAGSGPRRVVLWLFGGAFVGGTVRGNLGLAATYGRLLGCDVFVPHLGAFPEQTVRDQFRDGCRAYEWLLSRTRASHVVAIGFSSGAGCLLRTLQLVNGEREERQRYFHDAGAAEQSLPQPAGAVLIGGFFDYRPAVAEEMMANAAYDLVVSQPVVRAVAANMDAMCGGREQRSHLSPMLQPMDGLCPLFITTSEHEACWIQDCATAERAKAAGVDAELYTRPFLPHVYPLFTAILPEARVAQHDIVSWIRARGVAWSS